MPGWHERTAELQKSGQIQIVGVIQEQHPARCRLFMKWKQMPWPILVDSLNLLELKAVPIPMLIDENGIVRSVRARSRDLQEFIDTLYPAGKKSRRVSTAPDPKRLARKAMSAKSSADDCTRHADLLYLLGKERELDTVIEMYRSALEKGAGPEVSFRLGVALRRRSESPLRRPGDFQNAVDAWGGALKARPEQYIWRRRLQQYGPRLGKPYAFYDWVSQARKDIEARGETPPGLAVEPGGAEIARPAKTFRTAEGEKQPVNPDPKGRIPRDKKRPIEVEAVVAPTTEGGKRTARVHVTLRPDFEKKAHWNNEAGGLTLWVDSPEGCAVDRVHQGVERSTPAVSHEVRTFEFEVQRDAGASAQILRAYVLYYVCEDVDGVCNYLRQDIEIPLKRLAAR